MADLNSLVIFAKVVEAKGFSEAARCLKIPISTVSRRVAELEDQLSVRLLERSTRNLRLTDVGSAVLEYAQRSADLGEAVDNLVSNQLATVAGVLRLSAPPSISDTLLVPLLGAFQASYPRGSIWCFASAHLEIHRWSLGKSLPIDISWLRAPPTLKGSKLQDLQGICSITSCSRSRIGDQTTAGPFGIKTE